MTKQLRAADVYFNEHEPFAADWCQAIYPDSRIDKRSIKDVQQTDLAGFRRCHFFAGVGTWEYALQLAGWPADREVWTGSCPCQPFSAAGKRKGTADERHLWPEFLRLITECRPATIFGEQVASNAGRDWLAGVRADLEALGYAFGAADLCSAGTGEEAEGWIVRGDSSQWERIVCGPNHIRQRLYWVAHASGAKRGRRPEPEREHGGAFHVADGGANGRHADSGSPPPRQHRPGEGVEANGAQGAAEATDEHGRRGDVDRDSNSKCSRSEGAAAEDIHGSRRRIEGGEPWQLRAADRWSDFDIRQCLDGKARRIVARLVLLDDGMASGMALNGTKNQKEEEVNVEKKSCTAESLSSMLKDAGEKEIPERNTRRFSSVRQAEVLQPEVHGAVDGGEAQGSVSNEQTQAVEKGRKANLRKVRTQESGYAAVRASHRRKSDEQRGVEFNDVVRLMSSAYPLAIAEGDSITAEALCLLFPSSVPRQHLLNASFPDAKAWRPPSRAEIQRAWDSGAFKTAVIRGCNALTTSFPSRAKIIKCIGNGIVPQVAAVFVRAFLERTE